MYYCAETFSVSINSQTGTHQPLPVTLSSSQLHEQHKQHKQYEQHEQHKQHEQHEQNRQHEQHKQSKQHNHLERVKEIWQSIELKTNAEPLIQKLLADINGTFNQTQIKDTINPSTPSKLTRSLSVIQRSKTIVKGLLVDDGCLVYDESEYIMIELQGKLNDAQKSSGVDKQLKNTDESHHTKKGEESKSSFSNDVLLKGDDKSKCMSNVDAVKKQPIKRYSPVV